MFINNGDIVCRNKWRQKCYYQTPHASAPAKWVLSPTGT